MITYPKKIKILQIKIFRLMRKLLARLVLVLGDIINYKRKLKIIRIYS